MRDVSLQASCKLGGFGSVALWNLTLVNKSRTNTYADLRYRSMYESESGNRLATKRETLQIVLKPLETRRFEHNDGFIHSQTKRCGMELIGGVVRATAPDPNKRKPTPKPSSKAAATPSKAPS